jgi:CRISPR/Cas system-associated exonuclease Cas4 (RecB family)
MDEKAEKNLLEILSSPKELEKLLLLEKEKRGINRDRLLFIGMASTAKYYWCAIKSLFLNKKEELTYFSVYLEDRIRYSRELGRMEKLPKKPEELLEIGNDITLNDIEKLLKRKRGRGRLGRTVYSPFIEIIDPKTGKRTRILNPFVSNEEKEFREKEAKLNGIKIGDIKDYPKIRGEFAQEMRSEIYPTIRWNFNWRNYVVVGEPDGITKDVVYEFKTTGSEFLSFFIKPVALTQADLYGYFFNRKRKRVQIYMLKEDKIKTWDQLVDKENAINTLTYFEKVDEGMLPKPPKKWKCKNCEFNNICPLYKK